MALSYDWDKNLKGYARISRGFKAGGFNPSLAALQGVAILGPEFIPYQPEYLWNYELGLKSVWADSRVVFNAAAFFIDYQDLQASTRLDCGSSFTSNAGGAESKGIELELQFAATDDLRFSLGGSYIDTELTDDLPSGEGLKGDELNYVPNVKFNATMDYSRPLSGSRSAYMTLSYQYTGTVQLFYKQAANVPTTRDRSADAYDTVNLRIGVEAEKWEVAVFANNLFNEFATSYVDSITPNGPGGWVNDTVIRPRIIGLNAKFKF